MRPTGTAADPAGTTAGGAAPAAAAAAGPRSLCTAAPVWRRHGLEAGVVGLFLLLATAYLLFLPSFEGPDESEHVRYAQAYAEGAAPHPLDPQAPLRWGYQVHHPPLYYRLLGLYARAVHPAMPDRLTANAEQNPRYPFIRHDGPEERFPLGPVARGLRWLRLPSVLLGVVTALVLAWGFQPLCPRDPVTRATLLALAMLAPNTLQMNAVVANDALLLLLSSAALACALRVTLAPAPPAWLFTATGTLLGLGFWTKMTVFVPLAVVGSLWGLDLLLNRRWPAYRRGLWRAVVPAALLGGAYLGMNAVLYGSPTREVVLWLLTRAFHRAEPASVPWILSRMASGLPRTFLADLGWQAVHVEMLSVPVFGVWLAAVLWSLARSVRPHRRPGRRFVPAAALAGLCLLWAVVFIVLANRHWGNIQARHGWCVFPFSLVGLLTWTQGRRAARLHRRWRRPALAAVLLGALVVNGWLLLRARDCLRPSPDTLHDRDYHTLLYASVLNRHRARAYLFFGNFLTADYLEAFEQHRWEAAADLSRQAYEQKQWPTVARYVRAFSLHALKRLAEAETVVLPLKDTYAPAYPLYAQVLIDQGRTAEALAYVERVLPTCRPHEAVELRAQLARLRSPP